MEPIYRIEWNADQHRWEVWRKDELVRVSSSKRSVEDWLDKVQNEHRIEKDRRHHSK